MSSDDIYKIKLTSLDGTVWEYTDDADKEFFLKTVNNFSPIEDQTYSSNMWDLYTLEIEQDLENTVYYLCLSAEADTKRCLAYDSEANWYRIDPDDAKTILTKIQISTVDSYNEPPKIFMTVSGEKNELSQTNYEWNYLLADGSYATLFGGTDNVFESTITVSSLIGITLDFSLLPDWFDIKIFDDENLIFSGDETTLKNFSYGKDARLLAKISCKWYVENSEYYYGSVNCEFYFNYDIKATASLDKETYKVGEIAYITLENADLDNFEIETELITSTNPSFRSYNGKKCILLPISCYNVSGDYPVTLISENTRISLNIKITENDWAESNPEYVEVNLLSSNADEYETALENFTNEISLNSIVSQSEPLWKSGFITPVKKYVEGKQSYWITSPTFGYGQIVDGRKIGVKNFGYHYIQSAEFEHIDVRSIADGKVVFLGETTAFGTTVVIDHGFGLLSVYGHLGNVEISYDETVKQGDTIASSSDSGILMKSGTSGQVFFAAIYDGVFINPSHLFSEQNSEESSEYTLPLPFFNN